MRPSRWQSMTRNGLLRADEADRDAYLQVKRGLAKRTWRHVLHYADSKTAIVRQILERASAVNQQNQPGRKGKEFPASKTGPG